MVRIVGEAFRPVLAGFVEPVTLSTRLFDIRRGADISDGQRPADDPARAARRALE